jgi:hypothetical protein
MALIKCKECGKEISDKATACPHCGCPVQTTDEAKVEIQEESTVKGKDHSQGATQVKKKKKGHGCLMTIIVFALICVAVNVAVTNDAKDRKENPQKYDDSIAAKYIDVSGEESSKIDAVLNDCGITDVVSFEHDELLDNAHVDGETGYRIATKNADNIILYLLADKAVSQIRYGDYDLYVNGSKVATLEDYTVSMDDVNKYQYICQEKVKEILKSPSKAKFPNYTEWGFGKEKNIMTVQGYVDAQNSFGAETRSKFQFIIDTDTNTIQSFIFDGQEMITQ